MKKEEEEKNYNFENQNSSLNSSDNSSEKEQNNNDRCLFKIGEEATYALTFIARIIMTLYSFHGLFFILNFLIQFIILVPGLLLILNLLFFKLF